MVFSCGMTVTAHRAWVTRCWLTEPSSMPVNPPCTRLPTTMCCTSLEPRTSTSEALPRTTSGRESSSVRAKGVRTGAIPIAVGVAFGYLFIRRQKRLTQPLIDLKLFAIPAFTASLLVNLDPQRRGRFLQTWREIVAPGTLRGEIEAEIPN